MTQTTASSVRTLGPSAGIPNNFVVPFYLDDRKLRISVARVESCLHAFAGLCTCPGQACPLSGGLLEGTTLMCQCHGSKFDITTGAVIRGPATEPISVFAIDETDGLVQIAV